jgi:hypothetical protein
MAYSECGHEGVFVRGLSELFPRLLRETRAFQSGGRIKLRVPTRTADCVRRVFFLPVVETK